MHSTTWITRFYDMGYCIPRHELIYSTTWPSAYLKIQYVRHELKYQNISKCVYHSTNLCIPRLGLVFHDISYHIMTRNEILIFVHHITPSSLHLQIYSLLQKCFRKTSYSIHLQCKILCLHFYQSWSICNIA